MFKHVVDHFYLLGSSFFQPSVRYTPHAVAFTLLIDTRNIFLTACIMVDHVVYSPQTASNEVESFLYAAHPHKQSDRAAYISSCLI